MRASIQDEEEKSSCAIGFSENAQIEASAYRTLLVAPAQENGGAARTRRRSPLHLRSIARSVSGEARALADRDVVKESVGWVAHPVVVVVNQRERVRMPWYHTGRHQNPGVIVGAGMGQYG